MEPDTRYPPDDAREWLNRARSSLRQAETRVDDVYLEDLCYDAQQAAEKAIKAVLIVRNTRFPYVHDLDALLNVVEIAGLVVPLAVRAAAELTPYALELRYPNDEPIDEFAYERAIEIARRVVSWATTEVQRGGGNADQVREVSVPIYPNEPPAGEGRAPEPALIDALVSRIVAAAEPEKIILFGSAGRGSMGPRSDIDVLIVKSAPYDRAQLGHTVRTALRDLGIAVDVILATPDQLERYGRSWALVYRPALEEGRIVYEATQAARDRTK